MPRGNDGPTIHRVVYVSAKTLDPNVHGLMFTAIMDHISHIIDRITSACNDDSCHFQNILHKYQYDP